MSIGDWIILILNIACLAGSIVGAVKAHGSYKKCKQLTNFANLKTALDECQSIHKYSLKLLKLCGKNVHNTRGLNIEKEVSECGDAIKYSFAKIKEILPSSSQKIVDDLLTSSPNQNLDIDMYVSSLISGSALKNDNVTEFYISEIQKSVDSIQLHIKEMMEKMQDSEKRL